ncbi:cytochrome P450 [Pseudonocardia alni]|uniref:cytochrome P450 n=1 Tax=Pseudonocardia alni TaxID=33907 RepID=UPI0033C037DD
MTATTTPHRPPPGPRGPLAWHTARYWVAPRSTLRRWRRRHGDVVAARVAPMGHTLFLFDPDDIRTLVRAGQDEFLAGAANARLGGPSSEHSLLVVDGPQHAEHRALLTPVFHGRAVRGQEERIAAIAAREVERWPDDRVFPVLGSCRTVALEVILRVVLGFDEDDHAIGPAMTTLTASESVWEMAVGGLPGLRRAGTRRREAALTRAQELLSDRISAHRRDPRLHERQDALALLLCARDRDGAPLPDRAVSDQLLTLLVAGYETSAAALAWTLERLARDPEVHRRATLAADGDDRAWLTALVRESLRVRTVVPDLSRMAVRDTQLAGFRVPAGTIVTPCLDSVHESPAVFSDPQRMCPERFRERGSTTDWFAFGGGIRRCLGAAFAETELRVSLQEILRRRTVTAAGRRGERRVRRHITAEPARAARIRAHRRGPV